MQCSLDERFLPERRELKEGVDSLSLGDGKRPGSPRTSWPESALGPTTFLSQSQRAEEATSDPVHLD